MLYLPGRVTLLSNFDLESRFIRIFFGQRVIVIAGVTCAEVQFKRLMKAGFTNRIIVAFSLHHWHASCMWDFI